MGIIPVGVATLIAVPMVGGLAWRRARQRRIAKALVIDTPNGILEERFVRIGGVDQWIQLRGEDRDNPVLLVLHGGDVAVHPSVAGQDRAHEPVDVSREHLGRARARYGAAPILPPGGWLS